MVSLLLKIRQSTSMKTLFLLPILLLSLISCSNETADSVISCSNETADSIAKSADSLIKRDNLYYKKFSDTPFTGIHLKRFQNGNTSVEQNYKDGTPDGEFFVYLPNGQLDEKGCFKNRKKEGEWVKYWDTGDLNERGYYKNGKKEGKWVWFNGDGSLDPVDSGIYKNGKKISD
jgi:hypothetical protein